MVDLSTFFQSFLGTFKSLFYLLLDNKIVFLLVSLSLIVLVGLWFANLISNSFMSHSDKLDSSVSLKRGISSVSYIFPVALAFIIIRVIFIR